MEQQQGIDYIIDGKQYTTRGLTPRLPAIPQTESSVNIGEEAPRLEKQKFEFEKITQEPDDKQWVDERMSNPEFKDALKSTPPSLKGEMLFLWMNNKEENNPKRLLDQIIRQKQERDIEKSKELIELFNEEIK